MKFLVIGLACFGALTVSGLVAALVLIASAPPRIGRSPDIFGFASLQGPDLGVEIHRLERYPARDGEELADRIYGSSAERILIFIHGSSY
ncbi:MAG: hypothetical protein ABSG76_13170, partial [Xanthobacteraceae bacterium]